MGDDTFEYEQGEVVDGSAITIVPMDVAGAVDTYRKMVQFIQQAMREGIDYGIVPGTTKPSLYKPGAEKLQRFFRFSVVTKLAHSIEQWSEPVTAITYPLFHYRYTTEVRDPNGVLIATSDGEANSYERKYRWRDVPQHGLSSKWRVALKNGELELVEGTETEFDFAIEKKETTGQYGKPMEYWESWIADIASGKAVEFTKKSKAGRDLKSWRRESTVVRIPNEDVHTQVNTIVKISQKRSYVGGVIIASNASEFFSQDLEDYGKALDPQQSIRTYVPVKDNAARRLMDYVRGLGKADSGKWIKDFLARQELAWSLDNWSIILDKIDAEISGAHGSTPEITDEEINAS